MLLPNCKAGIEGSPPARSWSLGKTSLVFQTRAKRITTDLNLITTEKQWFFFPSELESCLNCLMSCTFTASKLNATLPFKEFPGITTVRALLVLFGIQPSWGLSVKIPYRKPLEDDTRRRGINSCAWPLHRCRFIIPCP